jgi:hypothetical protein
MAKNQPPRMVSGGPPKAANRGNPVPGGKAPAFRLPQDGGGTVGLADFAGRKLVLYRYPRADTSGCTRKAIDLSRLKSAFSRAGTDILGVSLRLAQSCRLPATPRRCSTQQSRSEPAAGCKSLTDADKIPMKSAFRFPNC